MYSMFLNTVTWSFICADAQSFVDYSINLQQQSMDLSLLSDLNKHWMIQAYLLRPGSKIDDCCSWRGVTCKWGEIMSLVIASVDAREKRWQVSMQWLPHSLQYIFTKAVDLAALYPEAMPRDLRYIDICDAQPLGRREFTQWNLSALPREMEELRLQTQHFVCCTVVIPSLPQNMRFCMIITLGIQKVIFGRECLPRSVEKVVIQSYKVKYVSIGSKKLDARIITTPSGPYPSVNSNKHAATCRGIEKEIRAQRMENAAR